MNCRTSVVEAESEQPSALLLVRKHHRKAGSGIQDAEPEPSRHPGMPSAGRFSIHEYAARLDESECTNVQREDERERGDRHSQLRGAVQRSVTGESLA